MNDEQMKEDETQEGNGGKFKQWLQNNIRIIISILIVVAIAGGIYSYSKRTEAPTEIASIEENLMEEEALENQEGQIEVEEEPAGTIAPSDGQQVIQPAPQETVQAPVSQETEAGFIETAVRGDGTTHLARRALANYLEKNPDSSLKIEHKIYIEDYLRKNVGKTGSLQVGESVEFSKTLVEQAITQAKQLNERQIQNLSKYVPLVPSLA